MGTYGFNRIYILNKYRNKHRVCFITYSENFLECFEDTLMYWEN